MKRKVVVIMTILLLAFIWLHSIIPEKLSFYESWYFTNMLLNPILDHLGVNTIDSDVIRKIAHVFEFLILSLFTSFYWNGNAVKNIYTGLTVAFLDESIQVITGRGALITDIWIDLIGVGIGTAIGSIAYKLMKNSWILRKQLKKKNQIIEVDKNAKKNNQF